MAATEKPYTGLTASLKIGTSTASEVLAYVSGVDLTLEKEIIEILAFGMQFKGNHHRKSAKNADFNPNNLFSRHLSP